LPRLDSISTFSSCPTARDLSSRQLDDCPVTEEASFMEHRAALDATVFVSGHRAEFVFELDGGRLHRRP